MGTVSRKKARTDILVSCTVDVAMGGAASLLPDRGAIPSSLDKSAAKYLATQCRATWDEGAFDVAARPTGGLVAREGFLRALTTPRPTRTNRKPATLRDLYRDLSAVRSSGHPQQKLRREGAASPTGAVPRETTGTEAETETETEQRTRLSDDAPSAGGGTAVSIASHKQRSSSDPDGLDITADDIPSPFALLDLCRARGETGDAATAECARLIALGAPLNTRDADGRTPLLLSTLLTGLEGVSRELIRAGAALNVQDRLGCSALINAAVFGHLETVEEIVTAATMAAAATPTAVHIGESAAEAAAATLLTGLHRTAAAAAVNAAAAAAVVSSTRAAAMQLCLLNSQDFHGKTALILAASAGSTGIVRMLVQFGASVIIKDNQGKTACAHAEENKFGIISVLLAAKAHEEEAEAEAKEKMERKRAKKDGRDEAAARRRAVAVDPTALIKLVREDPMALIKLCRVDGSGDLDECTTILETARKAGINIVDRQERATNKTALILATSAGRTKLVELLLHVGGAAIDLQDARHYSCLHVAAMSGQAGLVRILVDAGCNLNLVDQASATPLIYAADYGHTACVQILVDAGADVTLRDKYEQVALDLARDNEYDDIVAILKDVMEATRRQQVREQKLKQKRMQDQPQPNQQYPQCYLGRVLEPPVEVPSSHGSGAKREQQQQKQQQKQKQRDGRQQSSKSVQATAPKKAVRRDAVACIDDDGEVDPQAMVKMVRLNVFRYGGTGKNDCNELIARGINVDATDVDGLTALHHAAFNGRLAVLEVVVSAGCNLDLVDDQSRTPLLIAISQGDVAITKALLEAGADPNRTTKTGQTVLHVAALTSASVFSGTSGADLVRVLLETSRNCPNAKKIDVSVQDHYLQTALHLACSAGKTESVGLMLAESASRGILDVRDEDQRTALMNASGLGHVDIVKALIRAGADVNMQVMGRTGRVGWVGGWGCDNHGSQTATAQHTTMSFVITTGGHEAFDNRIPRVCLRCLRHNTIVITDLHLPQSL